jgi:hypothetical protein
MHYAQHDNEAPIFPSKQKLQGKVSNSKNRKDWQT